MMNIENENYKTNYFSNFYSCVNSWQRDGGLVEQLMSNQRFKGSTPATIVTGREKTRLKTYQNSPRIIGENKAQSYTTFLSVIYEFLG
jgi:hypothetical protein